MVRLCMVKAKLHSVEGTDENKYAIKQASDFADAVTAFFKEAFKLNNKLENKIENATEDDALQLFYGLCHIFCPNGYYAIGKKGVFSNTDLEPTYPDAICVWQNCLENLGFSDDLNDIITNSFMEIYNMWQNEDGVLPLYKRNIQNQDAIKRSPYYRLEPQDAIEYIAYDML